MNGYSRVMVTHGEGEYAKGAFSNNSIEGFWSHLKRGLFGIYHQVSPKHFARYCDEFTYRYNSRKVADNKRFQITLQRVNGWLKYKDLIRKSNGESKETQDGSFQDLMNEPVPPAKATTKKEKPITGKKNT